MKKQKSKPRHRKAQRTVNERRMSKQAILTGPHVALLVTSFQYSSAFTIGVPYCQIFSLERWRVRNYTYGRILNVTTVFHVTFIAHYRNTVNGKE